MNKTIIDNMSLQNKIAWYNIDKNGYMNKSIINQAAVYIYMKTPNLDDKASYYVGSSIHLTSRISSHRSFITYLDNYKKKGSPIFYRSVREHGWLNFKFGVLEYVDLSNIISVKQKRKTLLLREQYYLDNINPSLNTCKIADSPLGVKRDKMFSINLSKSRRGKSKKLDTKINKINNITKIVTNETRLLISSRCQGVNVKIFDKSNNLINEFPTITSAAKYFGVDNKTISTIYKTGKSYDDYTYKFEVKDTKVWVYDSNKELIILLDNIKKTSEWSNIAESTISNYIRSGKLYKNKFYFYAKQDVN